MNENPADNVLRAALAGNDPAAVGLFWDRYAKDLLAYLQAILCSLHDADDVVRKISGLVPLVGKDMFREQVEDFLKGCTEFRSSEPKAVAVDEDNKVSMVEWFVEYTHKFFGHIRQNHVCVQRWRDGKIYEEFLYVMQERVNN